MMLRRLIASAWTLVILGLCWTPRVNLPVREEGPPFLNIPHLDKMVHAGIFAVFAFFWMRAVSPPRKLLKVAAWGLGLTTLSELGQMAPIVGRDAGWLDGLADMAGVALGIAFYLMLPGGKPEKDPAP